MHIGGSPYLVNRISSFVSSYHNAELNSEPQEAAPRI